MSKEYKSLDILLKINGQDCVGFEHERIEVERTVEVPPHMVAPYGDVEETSEQEYKGHELLNVLDNLLSHLNGEENGMALKFRNKLEQACKRLDKLDALEEQGVEEWSGYEWAMDQAGLA